MLKNLSMSYSVKSIEVFEREAKKLIKKYPSLKSELRNLISNLKNEPSQGTSLGKNCYKIRLAISSKGKGKSGGARVITYCITADKTIYLLSIYDKSEKETISDKELKKLLSHITY